MREGKIKLMFYGDAVVPTGFARVLHSIQKYLPEEVYDISWLGINYLGDPHDFPFKIYPAFTKGDIWGINRIKDVVELENPDIIFLLNDAWVLANILGSLKDVKQLPQIVTYFPVDSLNFDRNWFRNYGIVARAFTYTEFGKQVVNDCGANIRIEAMPHGTDSEIFYKINQPKSEIKKTLYPDKPDFIESFIFLNANRNQPRKRIDTTVEAFGNFVRGKPENVKLYLHMGLRDSGWDINRLAKRYGLEKRVLISATSAQMPRITDEKLNAVYNATDCGLNSSTGEGWGLCSMEHAVTGAPQIVAAHSACKELFSDCGLTIEPKLWLTSPAEGLVSGFISADDLAEAMEKIYSDTALYQELSDKCYKKFTAPEYQWKTIAQRWHKVFLEVIT
jgi:D-inositol-3-phosphate glycosyltransferase